MMKIQINTDNNINGTEELFEFYKTMLAGELSRFEEQISRLEVHLSDEDANKDGGDDKRCLIEARLEGMDPTAVSDQADTHDQAVSGAIDKLKAALDTKIGKSRSHQRK